MFGSPIILPFISALQRNPRRPTRWHPLTPVQTVALGFAVLIGLGALLLAQPFAQQPGRHIGLLDCLFTATAATCVTGLKVVSTSESWSRAGQFIILLLIQTGGLGYMSLATLGALLLGLRTSLRNRLRLREAHGILALRDAMQVVRYVVLTALVIEGLGALFFTLRFHYVHGLPWGRSLFEGVFYAISGFCNAGFDLAPRFEGLTNARFQFDGAFLLALSALILLGGLGFGVLGELLLRVKTRRFSLHAKLVLVMTVLLLLIGMGALWLFESHNAYTLGGMATGPLRGITAWFMSVTARTGGFSTLDLSLVAPPTLLTLGLLMIIGASPDSAGGGVKTTTFAVIILAIIALVRRRGDIESFGRRISGDMVRLALSLLSIYLATALLIMFGLSLTETLYVPGTPQAPAEMLTRYVRLIFETISAMSNVGLSAGITPTLAPASRVLIILAMYLGRLGPLAFIYVYAQPRLTALRRLPAEPIVAG